MSLIEEHLFKEASDELSRLTVREARRYAALHPESALESVLKIRNLATYRRFELFNGEQLGIPIVLDKEVKYFGQRPLPKYVNHQLDIILNNFVIERHRKLILARLKSIVFGKNAISAWYEVYLTIYLLLEILEYAYQHQTSECARYQGMVSLQFIFYSD